MANLISTAAPGLLKAAGAGTLIGIGINKFVRGDERFEAKPLIRCAAIGAVASVAFQLLSMIFGAGVPFGIALSGMLMAGFFANNDEKLPPLSSIVGGLLAGAAAGHLSSTMIASSRLITLF
jgi:hypothetical protein